VTFSSLKDPAVTCNEDYQEKETVWALASPQKRVLGMPGPGRPAVRPLRLRAACTGLFIVAGGADFAIMDFKTYYW